MHRLTQFFSSLLLLTFIQISIAATEPEPHSYFYVVHRIIFNPELRTQLELTSEQTHAWDQMEIAIEQAHEQTRQRYDVFNAVVEQEALKFTPNIDTIYSAKQTLEQQVLQIDKQVNAAKINLYNNLTFEQQQIIKNRIFSDSLTTLDTLKDQALQDDLNLNLRQRILWRNALKEIQTILHKMQKTFANKEMTKRAHLQFKFVEQYHQLNVIRLKLYLQLNTHQQALLRQHWRNKNQLS
ncbi:MAG: hypothetical protein GKR77_05775 [Legionellales bacterium]|nr:hypothetical protein [Legionellales bacterium]